MSEVLADGDGNIGYVAKFNEYGIGIRGSDIGSITIEYCPWCGTKLPPSHREEWFRIVIDDLGLEPDDPKVPAEMHSELWWQLRK